VTVPEEGAVLDNPAWSALVGPHKNVAQRVGAAARYHPALSIFAGLEDDSSEGAWADAAQLSGGRGLTLIVPRSHVSPRWSVRLTVPCLQMVAPDMEGAPDDEAVPLSARDVPEMLDLVERTKPGPFLARTIELGRYLGVRRDGRLVAMAGERLHMPGWTEVSAVCTDGSLRGSGLASRLVRAVVEGIRARGERPLLHVAADNVVAIRVYRALGFVDRRAIDVVAVRPRRPDAAPMTSP